MEERGSNNNVIQEGDEEHNQLDDLSEDLEKRYHELEEMTKGKTEEEVVQLKIHQLAVSKVLVFTYGKSDFRLVKAHAELGGAYLNYKCYEQAIDHLTMALKKNSKLNDSREAKEFNYRILTWLGKCYLEAGNVEDAIEILEKAYQEVIAIKGEDDIECAAIMTLLSNCNTQTKEYDIALDYLSKVWSIAEANYGFKSESCALVYVETAKVYIAKEDFTNAIDYQTRAINLMNELKTDKLEYLSELYKTLSNLQEKVNDTNGYLESHKKIRDIFMQLYGQTDKKTMKVKRHLALGLLKSGQNQEALQELLETEEMEVNFYGESSTQVAKTQKIIGTLLLLMKEYVEALKYFNKAMKIFNDNGAKNSVAEIKKKIQMIKEMKEKGELK